MSLVSGTVDKVIGDITGVTGLNILTAIINGERNPKKLAQLAHQRIKSSPEQIAKALTGKYREEMVFILNQELSLYQIYQQQICLLDVEIEKYLKKFESKTEDCPPKLKGQKRKKTPGNEPNFNLHQHLYRITGVVYQDLGTDYYQQKYQERMVKNLEKKALSLGFELVAKSE